MEKTNAKTKNKVNKHDICKAEADEVKTMMLLNAIHENDLKEEKTEFKNEPKTGISSNSSS